MVIDLKKPSIVSKYIDSIKQDSFERAMEAKLHIIDSLEATVGHLIPVGSWILENEQLLTKISSWRNKFSRMFPTQNVVTSEDTRNYLGSLIKSSDAILFLIQDSTENIIGHIGLVNFDDQKCELAHLMRGENTKNTEIIYHAERTLVRWSTEISSIELIYIEAMSYNLGAIALHEKVGFKKIKKIPIKKMITSKGLEHRACSMEESNVNYSIDIYELEIFRPLKSKVYARVLI